MKTTTTERRMTRMIAERVPGGLKNQHVVDLLDDLDTQARMIEVMRTALENCTGGDLASGEGIYKAEIAREALADVAKMEKGEG